MFLSARLELLGSYFGLKNRFSGPKLHTAWKVRGSGYCSVVTFRRGSITLSCFLVTMGRVRTGTISSRLTASTRRDTGFTSTSSAAVLGGRSSYGLPSLLEHPVERRGSDRKTKGTTSSTRCSPSWRQHPFGSRLPAGREGLAGVDLRYRGRGDSVQVAVSSSKSLMGSGAFHIAQRHSLGFPRCSTCSSCSRMLWA